MGSFERRADRDGTGIRNSPRSTYCRRRQIVQTATMKRPSSCTIWLSPTHQMIPLLQLRDLDAILNWATWRGRCLTQRPFSKKTKSAKKPSTKKQKLSINSDAMNTHLSTITEVISCDQN